ncbi:unnamed protein product [Callosobruchus maculatus]|uniref:Uncharacterized protein n=1 Tax=Callosobruchus maculatus TaxID=64391 RepID=A0A653C6T8_CALMS|nr:unnamed protein product [Callosobruchus maculatus]
MKNQTVMASVRRQEMQVTSAHEQNADCSAAAAKSQNGTYLKNMPRIKYNFDGPAADMSLLLGICSATAVVNFYIIRLPDLFGLRLIDHINRYSL